MIFRVLAAEPLILHPADLIPILFFRFLLIFIDCHWIFFRFPCLVFFDFHSFPLDFHSFRYISIDFHMLHTNSFRTSDRHSFAPQLDYMRWGRGGTHRYSRLDLYSGGNSTFMGENIMGRGACDACNDSTHGTIM